ncbi:SIR2 family protein [Treponema endosymbiont of Eucomonympha sp.]|uniref:SIR2 family protein n=1 Tax=Treponema endosymbiont of Eucomonympha sp. TaxID=1580831 RepID=UPI000ACF5409|nr:SIR2 family protein [Treponema endosymbiont of Eucomonympha sp.]
MAGLPVMSNFIEKTKDIYFSSNENNGKYSHFNDFFIKINELSIIKNYFNTDLFNIEELLSILDMENNLGEKENNTDIINFIIDVINFYSENKISIEYENQEHMNLWDCVFGKTNIQRNIIAFVSSLFKLTYNFSGTMPRVFSSNHCYSVISLNYDTLLETAIASISHIFNPEHKFEKKDYVEDWSNPMLFKIHGDIKTGQIIPPTWAKNITDDMRKIWKNAFELLKNSRISFAHIPAWRTCRAAAGIESGS